MHAVHVTLVKAVDLPSADFNGKSDPYVIFQLANTMRKSSVIQANLNPEWDPEETFSFIAEDIQSAVLDVKVFDHDRISKDDIIGSCQVPLNTLHEKPESEVLMYQLEVPSAFAKQKRKSAIMLEIKLEKED
ncbi:Predicted Ca2-dependent phospholipid-binding protein [Plasmopara halstedii]|uniref:Predicted Ca2-dependent phospholipid-binding protein n=1 Tax=Plasmopara halstedii TaxID=4781 RepID=A0A0P1A6D7_PLAHL|nr:Predicted Ca2-dependent phospholipid-binding protein [Plasmopara halstedii]CEG36152.1 Predicted Ca2-dependent phospholipid-binding protein [Plasmopara halstedii]|eukprot:XP_024572521.1 Predicted Ca2-dependent phospholipid-binding protein [Plasmopara halstedii]